MNTATQRSKNFGTTISVLGLSLVVFAAALFVGHASIRADEGSTFLGSQVDPLIATMGSAAPQAFALVGHTSTVFRIDFSQGRAAFKPISRQHPGGHIAELAAFRLAQALAIDSVPPCVARSFSREEITRLYRGTRSIESGLNGLLWDGSRVRGTMIHWVDGLSDPHLDDTRSRTEWMSQLRASGTLTGNLVRLSELSTMVAFDFLIANPDRYSGGNLKEARGRIVLRDHNLAFTSSDRESTRQRFLQSIENLERFSRRFVDRLRAVNRETFQSVLTHAGLSVSAARAATTRRNDLLQHIDTLVARHGRDAVLCFP